jgi:hypothetical protein
LLLLVGLGGAGLSAIGLAAEAQPFLGLAGGAEDNLDRLSSGGVSAGLSASAQRLVLDACVGAIASPLGAVQPEASRDALLANCRTVASAIANQNPGSSFAWYAVAAAAVEQGDAARFNAALLQSRATGPNEERLGAQRVQLAEGHRQMLQAPALAAEDADLAMLVLSRRGIGAIAARYVRDPTFRERITGIVETLPPEAQRRFVGSVSQAVRG